MKLAGDLTIAAPRQAVFDALRDARLFAACVDGVRDLEEIDATHYRAVMETKVAYIKFKFDVAIEVTARYPNAISFAPGRPYEGFFEPEDLRDCLDAFLGYLRKDLKYDDDQVRAAMFQYGRTKGLIHELIARTVANDEGIVAAPEDFVVTVGAQEGMLLTLRALCADRRDVILVSSLCYIGITGAARLLDIETVAVPEREDWSAAARPWSTSCWSTRTPTTAPTPPRCASRRTRCCSTASPWPGTGATTSPTSATA